MWILVIALNQLQNINKLKTKTIFSKKIFVIIDTIIYSEYKL